MPMLNNWILSGLFFITMKKFEITKEQILDLCLASPFSNEHRLRYMFPEAFEPELKTGIWYKSTNKDEFFFFLEELDYKQSMENYCKSYGFNLNGTWESSGYRSFDLFKNRMKPATEEEVFEKLKKEAVKIGFKQCVTVDSLPFKDLYYNPCEIIKITSDDFWYNKESETLSMGGVVIYSNGIWAEICITKEEAEKELGKKII